MSNGRRFDKTVWIRLAVIAVLVLAILIVLPTTRAWLNVKENLGDQNKYMLSAIAQVLAALLALVFSITLIATQFVTKYTHRTMRMVFNNRIIFYMVARRGRLLSRPEILLLRGLT